MALNTLSEMLRGPVGTTISGVAPSTAKPILMPLAVTSVDADTGVKTFGAIPDTTGRCVGFLTRPVATTIGSDATYFTFGTANTDGTTETPFQTSKSCSLYPVEPGMEFIFEDGTNAASGYIDYETSNYAISTNTSAGTPLTWKGGKFAVAYATGEVVQFVLVAQLTPITDSGIRILVRAISGYLKPA